MPTLLKQPFHGCFIKPCIGVELVTPYLQMLMRLLLDIIRWLDEKTMVTAFLQLHDDVQEARGTAPATLGKSPVVPGKNPPGMKEGQI